MPAIVNKEECVGCGACVEECPVECISLNDVAKVDEDECIECGACVEVCPVECISLNDDE